MMNEDLTTMRKTWMVAAQDQSLYSANSDKDMFQQFFDNKASATLKGVMGVAFNFAGLDG